MNNNIDASSSNINSGGNVEMVGRDSIKVGGNVYNIGTNSPTGDIPSLQKSLQTNRETAKEELILLEDCLAKGNSILDDEALAYITDIGRGILIIDRLISEIRKKEEKPDSIQVKITSQKELI